MRHSPSPWSMSRRVRLPDHGRELVTNADLTAHRAEVRADLTALELRLIKWIVGTGIAIAAAIPRRIAPPAYLTPSRLWGDTTAPPAPPTDAAGQVACRHPSAGPRWCPAASGPGRAPLDLTDPHRHPGELGRVEVDQATVSKPTRPPKAITPEELAGDLAELRRSRLRTGVRSSTRCGSLVTRRRRRRSSTTGRSTRLASTRSSAS